MPKFFLSDTSRSRLEGCDPRALIVVERAITITLIDFGIPRDGGLRTAKRQNEMYNDPSIQTNCDGYNNKSMHQSGKAFDVYAYVDGKASWDDLHLTHVATAILSSASKFGWPLTWGGHFGKTGWDKPHFQFDD